MLAGQWRRLNRAATTVAILTSPALFLALHRTSLALWLQILLTILGVAAFRGLVDVGARRLIPWPSLFGAEPDLLAEDVISRRRAWYWRRRYHIVGAIVVLHTALWIFLAAIGHSYTWFGLFAKEWDAIVGAIPMLSGYLLILPLFFFMNLIILFGPMLFFGLRQIKGYEPGDADWGVRLEHVRGQKEAKREVTRIIDLWQSGDEFEKAGGKRERGLLFLGPPGTGKTMLAKAIATGFNCPFVTMPGSGFQQTFMGMDVILIQFLARKAKKLAAKWGGQCIIFIDEIDAVGMRRASLGQGAGASGMTTTPSIHDYCYHGASGSLSSTCGLVVETAAWRERQFADRASPSTGGLPPALANVAGAIRRVVFPGGMGGMGGQGMALNQLLIVMDGIDDPPAMRRWATNRFNTFLDALYIVPQRVGAVPIRLPRPRPAPEQIYFIGACNVPIEALDPALTRPGRMGRHIRFRTPIKDDRKDIFDHYLAKVDHEPDLDSSRRREELARVTNGYSPAMIEQICSMALTYAHHDGRPIFGWGDIVEAMATIEAGTAVGVEYVGSETKAVAIHEAGHAAASHVYMNGTESTRLTIRMRGGALGHHQAIEKEERFSHFRSEEFARLVWTMGAIAAEQVFYGENSQGVAGDMQSATSQAALMVGVFAMGPERIDFGRRFRTRAEEHAAREKIMRRFAELGEVLMSRAAGMAGMMGGDPVSAAMSDPAKRRAMATILGQAYFTAVTFVAQNKAAVERIADTLVERKEMHGDEVVEMLDDANLKPAQLDYVQERSWPTL
jgi:ATP-dependent Zn protease